MPGSAHDSRGNHYRYYRCPSSTFFTGHGGRHATPYFRADLVDDAAWEWVKSFLMDPAVLASGLSKYQGDLERESAPLRDRLEVIDALLADNHRQLERLLDLYLTGRFPADVLSERRARLETTIGALDRERSGLLARLEADPLTPAQARSLEEFAAEVAEGLAAVEEDFAVRQRVIDALDVQAILAVEDRQQVAHLSCAMGKTVCNLRRTQSEV
jgi:hypothetical protein